MPFADAAGRVTGGSQHFAESNGVWIQGDIIKEYAVGQRALSCQQGSPRGRTDREAGYGVDKRGALSSQSVEMRRPDVGITGEAKGLGSPLVSKHDEEVGAR